MQDVFGGLGGAAIAIVFVFLLVLAVLSLLMPIFIYQIAQRTKSIEQRLGSLQGIAEAEFDQLSQLNAQVSHVAATVPSQVSRESTGPRD